MTCAVHLGTRDRAETLNYLVYVRLKCGICGRYVIIMKATCIHSVNQFMCETKTRYLHCDKTMASFCPVNIVDTRLVGNHWRVRAISCVIVTFGMGWFGDS